MSRRTVSFFNTAISFLTIATMVLALVPAFPQIVSAAGTVLFTDSFENEPAFSSPTWTADSQWGTTGSNAYTGSRKARVLGHASSTDTLETTIDTSDYENISLAFWYKLDGLDVGDSVVVEWFDGSVWNEVVSLDGQSGDGDDSVDWIVSSSTLPAGAADKANFAIRFTSNLDTGSDQFLLDDVTVEGDEISAPVDTVPPPTRPALSGEVIYDAVHPVLPSGYPSLGYEATQTYELGDKITFGGSSRQLDKVAITLTSWACESGGWNTSDCETTPGATFSHPITLNLYKVANDGTVGDEIASVTQTFDIPYRPSANPACSDEKQWMDTNEDCFNGYNHVVVFDLSGVSVPDTIIYGVAYNTSHYGETPIGGANGPYDSLNVGLNTDEPAPYIGTDVDNDEVFWDTTYSGYTRGFKADSDWAPYKVAAIFTAVPKTTETIVVFDDTAAGENQPGWLFNRDGSTATPFAFDTEESSIGDGSLHVFPIANDYAGTPPGCSSGVGCDKFIAEYFALTEMGDIDSFSYDFNIGDGGAPSDANQFYLSVYANFAESGATKFYDCRYSVVPSTGSVGGWTTVTFDPSSTYSVATRGGSSPSPHACPSSPENMGADAIVRAFAINLGDTSVSDQDLDGYFDNVVFETSNKITTYDFDPEPTATVTMCKMKPDETPLGGWTLKLKGEHVQNVVVPANTPNGVDTTALEEGKSYLAEVSGVWLNDRNPDNHVDAEYSTEDVWETHMDGFTGYGNDILDLQVDNNFVDWGPYNGAHTYAASFIATSSNPVKFRVYDGEGGVPNASWYNDNSGSLSVSVYEGYAGVTDLDDEGCVTFEGVPYGTYDVEEIAQEGWVNVPELSTSTVTVDQDEVTVTVVNTEEVAPMCSVTVVSDESNFVVEKEGNAVLTWAHTAWTAVIDEAEWIWGSYYVQTPTVTEVQTFTKTFDWSGNIANASLVIATDNYYEVYLNGDFVASSTEDQLFKEENKDTIDVSAFVIAGENTLEIKVTNLGVPDSSATSNPAGLKYNLTVVSDEEGEDCMFAPEPGLEITDPATDHLVLADTHTFEAVYVDADENDDLVLWAIRAGTCNSGTNTKAGNVDGFSDPYNWNGSKLSATVDMSGWDDGEYCFVVNPTEDSGTNFREVRWFTLENTAPTQCTIESSTSTVVVENNSYAVAAWTHNNWTDDIFGATWIWETEFVEDPEATTTLTFKETFNATGITDASFEIASDNTYRVFINGDLVHERTNVNNYQTPDVWNDVLPFLQEGENELLVEVTNIGVEGTISKTNPAGALFKLEMEVGGACEITTDLSEGEAETYEVFGYVWNDEDEDQTIDGDESYRGGVAVSITNGTTTVATSTDTNGRYQFNVEAGTWTITADIGSDWDFTTPDNSGHSHVVSVSTSTGPYNFGTAEDSGTSGGGGGGNNNDDEDEGGAGGGNTTLDDETPSGPVPQVAGAFTGQGNGGTGDTSGGEQGRVLGESTSTEEMSTTTDEGSVVSKIMDKVFGDNGDEDGNCKYWWIFVIVWLIVSAVMYYFKGWGEGLISTLSTQLVFGVLALLGLMSYFITGVACVIWPALIVGVGSAILLFINSNLRDDKVI